MKTKLDERRLRDLCRRIEDVAKKSAERRYPDAYIGRRHTVTVAIDAADEPESFPVGCQMYCEVSCEVPSEEQGDRSHADGARSLAIAMGLHRCVVRVRVRCVQRSPARFEPEKCEVQEVA